nr:PREDICTED: transmembrane protein 170B isoform X2 [Latimeria chalumnae]|eukprot:XP_014350553.1 PREDICTED: transmembrane protein 170B isoform X2 [Latimeria chalumnae]
MSVPRGCSLQCNFTRSGGGGERNMKGGADYSINLSVQQVLSLWAHGAALKHFTEMWYWVFLWALFSSLFLHGAVGLLMFVMLQRHKHGRVISVILVSVGFLASVTGGMITTTIQILYMTIVELENCLLVQRDVFERRRAVACFL